MLVVPLHITPTPTNYDARAAHNDRNQERENEGKKGECASQLHSESLHRVEQARQHEEQEHALAHRVSGVTRGEAAQRILDLLRAGGALRYVGKCTEFAEHLRSIDNRGRIATLLEETGSGPSLEILYECSNDLGQKHGFEEEDANLVDLRITLVASQNGPSRLLLVHTKENHEDEENRVDHQHRQEATHY